MADNGAMIVTWKGARDVPQDKTFAVLGAVLAYYDERQKEGTISGYRMYGSTNGDQMGVMVIEGSLAKLAQLSVESETLKLLAKANTVVTNLESKLYAGGSADDLAQYIMAGQAAAAEV